MHSWPDQPLNVLTTWPGKNIFELIDNDQIVVRPAGPDGEAVAPDLIVVPCAKQGSFDHQLLIDGVSRAAWARVASGKAALVFDASREGVVHDPEQIDAYYGLMRRAGITPDRCAYITQDRTYRQAHEEYCASHGLRPMTILTYDYFIRQFFRRAELDGAETLEQRLATFEARTASRPRRFISLNLSPRSTKMMMLLALIRDGLWDQGYISFPGFDKSVNVYAFKMRGCRDDLRKLPGFEDLAAELDPHMTTLKSYGSITVGWVKQETPNKIKAPVTDTPMPEHDQSWFTIVPETEMIGPERITEKPFKSLVNFHPSMILGNPRSLVLLRELGFKTFDGYVDEAYDVEPDPRRRFDMVYGEVRRLCALPEEELRRLERQWADTLVYNAHWGLTQLPRVYRDQIDPELVDRLLDLLDADAATARLAASSA